MKRLLLGLGLLAFIPSLTIASNNHEVEGLIEKSDLEIVRRICTYNAAFSKKSNYTEAGCLRVGIDSLLNDKSRSEIKDTLCIDGKHRNNNSYNNSSRFSYEKCLSYASSL